MTDPRKGWLLRSAGRKAGALGRSAPALLAALLLLAAFAVVSAGCGSDSPPATTTAAGLPTEEDSHAVEAEYNQPPKPAQTTLGKPIVLNGINIGVRLRVTATRVLDPAPGVSKPAGDGKRYVAIQLNFLSTGIAVFESEIRNAALTYGSGGRAAPMRTVTARCTNGFDAIVRLDVGERTTGCLLFRVPGDAKPQLFQLALETRPVQDGGKWTLR